MQRIDLSGNPSLPLDDVLTSLSSLHRLVDVALMVNTQLNKKVKMADSEKAAKSDGVLTQNVKEIETDSGKTDVKQLDLEKGVSLESMIVNNGQIKSKRNYREDALFMLLKNNNRLLMFDYVWLRSFSIFVAVVVVCLSKICYQTFMFSLILFLSHR